MSTTETDAGTATDPGTPADESELGAAGAQLSTAPPEEISVPSLGPIGWARWFWRQLTSMRVALLLLLLLSLAAIPGSLIPQTSIDPVKVQTFHAEHKTLAPIYDKVGLFHVYSSVWFSAIYLLLFVSLIGCILPRSWQFLGQLRSRPPAAPRRLTRLPAYTTWHTDADPEQVLGAARKVLKRRRFRVHASGGAIASEKGYLREAGNLLFHIALVVLLLSFAGQALWKSTGGKLVVEGDGFSNTLTEYDDFSSGALFNANDLPPFGFTLNSFDASYEINGPDKGTPREFKANITYWNGADGPERKTTIEVNKPLNIEGNKVYLISHGYAPVVTVRDGTGQVAYQGAVPFLQQDVNFTSTGVVKVPNAVDKNGKSDQLGFTGFFVPTFGGAKAGTMFSQFPAADYPVMVLTAYHGNLGMDSGAPQNVYQLDTAGMKQFKDAKGNPVAQKLLPGESMKLPNGAGSLKFDGIKQWASFQVSHQPGNGYALAGAIAALVGLTSSLFIQRRRVWVRATPGEDGTTVVEMAGLGRSESARLPEELADLAVALQDGAPAVPEPEPGASKPSSKAASSESASSKAGASEPGSEPEPAAEPGTGSDPAAEPTSAADSRSAPNDEADAKADTKPDAKADTKPDVESGPESVDTSDDTSRPKADAQSGVKPRPEAEAESMPKPIPESGPESDSTSEPDSPAKPASTSASTTGTDTGTDAGPESDAPTGPGVPAADPAPPADSSEGARA
jgi:cytochrome c biogenesis protein